MNGLKQGKERNQVKLSNMGPIDTGPSGCWIFAGIMAIVGLFAAGYGIYVGIQWLINHVHIS